MGTGSLGWYGGDPRNPLNPLSPHDALKHHFTSLKIFLQLRVLDWKFPLNYFTNTFQFSLIFSITSNHLHSLQVENCGSNSRLVVNEDDYGKFRPERVNSPVANRSTRQSVIWNVKPLPPVSTPHSIILPITLAVTPRRLETCPENNLSPGPESRHRLHLIFPTTRLGLSLSQNRSATSRSLALLHLWMYPTYQMDAVDWQYDDWSRNLSSWEMLI